jgi:hypothetical protein
MKTSILKAYFNREISLADFIKSIEAEVATYKTQMAKTGYTIPLIFHEDDELILSRSSFKVLLEDFVINNTTRVALSYICDCLTLAQKVDFVDEDLKETVFDLADPEINGGYKTQSEIKSIVQNL